MKKIVTIVSFMMMSMFCILGTSGIVHAGTIDFYVKEIDVIGAYDITTNSFKLLGTWSF